MLFAQAKPIAKKDLGSNYVFVQWIGAVIMWGLLWLQFGN